MSRSKYTAERLAPIVAAARSIAEVLRALGLQPTGGNYRQINARIRALDLDTAHFTGARWNRGESADTHVAIRDAARRRRLTDAAVFVENCPYAVNPTRLAGRLLRLGRAYACEACGLTEWRGRPLTLHLDHVNGIHNDHRLEYLRFLCPNCHQQTHTWGRSRR